MKVTIVGHCESRKVLNRQLKVLTLNTPGTLQSEPIYVTQDRWSVQSEPIYVTQDRWSVFTKRGGTVKTQTQRRPC